MYFSYKAERSLPYYTDVSPESCYEKNLQRNVNRENTILLHKLDYNIADLLNQH